MESVTAKYGYTDPKLNNYQMDIRRVEHAQAMYFDITSKLGSAGKNTKEQYLKLMMPNVIEGLLMDPAKIEGNYEEWIDAMIDLNVVHPLAKVAAFNDYVESAKREPNALNADDMEQVATTALAHNAEVLDLLNVAQERKGEPLSPPVSP